LTANLRGRGALFRRETRSKRDGVEVGRQPEGKSSTSKSLGTGLFTEGESATTESTQKKEKARFRRRQGEKSAPTSCIRKKRRRSGLLLYRKNSSSSRGMRRLGKRREEELPFLLSVRRKRGRASLAMERRAAVATMGKALESCCPSRLKDDAS